MKGFNLLFALIVFITALTSCSHNNEPVPTKSKSGGTISFSVDGQSMTLSENSINVAQGYFFLQSLVGTNEKFSIAMALGIGVTTYDINTYEIDLTYKADNGDDFKTVGDKPSGVFTLSTASLA